MNRIDEIMRRVRACNSLLFCAMQTAVGDNQELRLKLIHEASDALRGKYPEWWTETDHVQLERDADGYNARMAELAANPQMKVVGVTLEVPDDQPLPTVTYTDQAGKQHTMKGGRKI